MEKKIGGFFGKDALSSGWGSDKKDEKNKGKNEALEGFPEQRTGASKSGVSSTNHSYFEKKGEINELRRLLRALNEKKSLSNETELREALKKVIGVMTMGIDVTELFPEILMLTYTR